MIKRLVYYIEADSIRASDVVAAELREFEGQEMVILTLRSGVRISENRACFSLRDLLIQLKRDFEECYKNS